MRSPTSAGIPRPATTAGIPRPTTSAGIPRPADPGPAAVDELLGSVRRCAAAMAADTPTLPVRVSVAVGDLTVEVAVGADPLAAVPAGANGRRADDQPADGRAATTPVARAAPTDGGSIGTGPEDGAAEPAAPHHHVTAPTVGVFYAAPEPGAPPFVQPGDQVAPGQQIGIVEAMKLMIPVEADATGTVVEVLVASGTPVEFGERLLALAATDQTRAA